MRRGETIFEIDPELKEALEDGIATQGSNLSGVSARCSYSIRSENEDTDKDSDLEKTHSNNESVNEKSNAAEENDIESRASRYSSMSVSHDRNSKMSFASETGTNEPFELIQTKFVESLSLKFNYEAGNLLPLALRLCLLIVKKRVLLICFYNLEDV